MDFKLWIAIIDSEHMTKEQVAEAAWIAATIAERDSAKQRTLRVGLFNDRQANLIDDMAALCGIWKTNRDTGRTPEKIREAILLLAKEIAGQKKGWNWNPIRKPDPEVRK